MIRSVGYVPLNDPVSGQWPFSDYPIQVDINGSRFIEAYYEFPYVGVVAQYREDRDYGSKHLMVYDDGSYLIDHLDEANPDRGHVSEHLMLDVMPTTGGFIITSALAASITLALIHFSK